VTLPDGKQLEQEAHRAIVDLLSEMGRPASAVGAEATLRDDLALDSLELITLAVGLEDRFRILLDEGDAAATRTVADLARLVAERARGGD
jgi:acyl carrier protein